MGFTVQVRHPTGGVDAADYWAGFVIRHSKNTTEGPMPRFGAVEIAALNLGVQEERRTNGGFSFPLELHHSQRFTAAGEHDKSIVPRFYAKFVDLHAAFPQFEFIDQVDFLFGRRTGTLAAVGMPVEFHFYQGDSLKPFAHLTVSEKWWPMQAVKCCLVRKNAGQVATLAPNAEKPELAAAHEFNGSIESYLKEMEDIAVKVVREGRENIHHANAAGAIDQVVESLHSATTTTRPAEAETVQHTPAPGSLAPTAPAVPIVNGEQPVAAAISGERKGLVGRKPKRWRYVMAAVFGLGVFLVWQKDKTPTQAELARQVTSEPQPAKTPPSPVVTSIAEPAAATQEARAESAGPDPGAGGLNQSAAPAPEAAIEVPIGNSPARLEDLYKFGFNEHLAAVKTMLLAAKNLDRAEFDRAAEWMRQNRQALVEWPQETAKSRRLFNERIEGIVNQAKAAGDKEELTKAIALSESFLTSHFGYSTAHLNLSIAQSAVGNGKSALAPAFHTIVFNPDGANGWVALGVALARSGDSGGATYAFCTALRKAKFSPKTVAYFEKVARGEDLNYPEVTEAMTRSTTTACPRSSWDETS
jgi:hypothetical protein